MKCLDILEPDRYIISLGRVPQLAARHPPGQLLPQQSLLQGELLQHPLVLMGAPEEIIE